MQVKLETGFPGAYDHIAYKGAEISTFEQDDIKPHYTGKFAGRRPANGFTILAIIQCKQWRKGAGFTV